MLSLYILFISPVMEFWLLCAFIPLKLFFLMNLMVTSQFLSLLEFPGALELPTTSRTFFFLTFCDTTFPLLSILWIVLSKTSPLAFGLPPVFCNVESTRFSSLAFIAFPSLHSLPWGRQWWAARPSDLLRALGEILFV